MVSSSGNIGQYPAEGYTKLMDIDCYMTKSSNVDLLPNIRYVLSDIVGEKFAMKFFKEHSESIHKNMKHKM